MDRRKFLESGAVAAAALGLGGINAISCTTNDKKGGSKKIKFQPQTFQAPDGEIRSFLMHLGHNMWYDWPTVLMGENLEEAILKLPESKRPDIVLSTKDSDWKKVTDHAAEKGINMIVVDMGEGVEFPSHPELAIPGTWSVEKMQAEIARLNSLGIEVIPKLNFSTTHNCWLKDYRHMISSAPYYKVCEELIADAYEIFGHPRFFHIGYDEERIDYQGAFTYKIMRSGESWWYDFLHIINTVEALGARPMMWSDYGWDNADEFLERCPKSVIQQNWFYDDPDTTSPDSKVLKLFKKLDEAGFDQIPAGSNWVSPSIWHEHPEVINENMKRLVPFCDGIISKKHLLGYMMAPWDRSAKDRLVRNLDGIDIFYDSLKR